MIPLMGSRRQPMCAAIVYEKVFVREWGRRLLMAEIKKPEINKAADTKTSTVTTPVAATAAKTEPVASAVKAEAKTETKTEAAKETKAPAEKKKPGRKPGTKTAAKKPGRKPAAAKKETAKTTTAKKTTRAAKTTAAAKKTAVKESLHLEFAGKSYTPEDLVKSAKDVWKYDLKRKVGDFKSVELYVKPEESMVYYVINGDVKGNFPI